MREINLLKLLNLSLITIFGFALFSCISLKSEYPEIKYYKLEQTQSLIDKIQPTNSALLIRSFTAANHLDGDRIIAYNSESIAQRYFYHRWAAETPDLVTDFFIERYNKLGAFSSGVIRTSASQNSDYLLEGDILEMHAYNSESNKADSNYAKFTIRISLLKREPLKLQQKLLLQKVYTSVKKRGNHSVGSIAPSLNEAIAEAADNILSDILQATVNEEK